MSAAISVPAKRGVLADAIPGALARDAVLVLCGALLTSLGAQIAVSVPPSPVPITGQTLAVVVAGAALGAHRGGLSQLLYLVLGLFLPVYAGGEHGLSVLTGATGGYIVGFVLAGFAIGWLAERGADRRPLIAFAAFVTAQALVFGIGVPWLKIATGSDWSTAIHDGFTIFIVGGIVKAIVAAVVTPLAWRGVRRIEGR
jgi:biotin transport system substrate-specific component